MRALLRDEIGPAKPYTPIKDLTRLVRETIVRQFEIGRISRLKRYTSPQIVDGVLNREDGELFESQRREITVVFLDLRGFSAVSEVAAPEEALQLLRMYHAEMGRLIFKYKGTIERFAGDGIMVFFNDPIPCADHRQRAVRMALEMHDRIKPLRSEWLKKGWDLDLGVGLAAGYAALGNAGFAERMDYGAAGTVTHLASRLCEQAKGGQILTNQKTLSEIDGFVDAEPMGELNLRGFLRPVAAFNVTNLKQRSAHA
jgi:adenylate cyclase